MTLSKSRLTAKYKLSDILLPRILHYQKGQIAPKLIEEGWLEIEGNVFKILLSLRGQEYASVLILSGESDNGIFMKNGIVELPNECSGEICAILYFENWNFNSGRAYPFWKLHDREIE